MADAANVEIGKAQPLFQDSLKDIDSFDKKWIGEMKARKKLSESDATVMDAVMILLHKKTGWETVS